MLMAFCLAPCLVALIAISAYFLSEIDYSVLNEILENEQIVALNNLIKGIEDNVKDNEIIYKRIQELSRR